MGSTISFLIADLLQAYRSGRLTPRDVVEEAWTRAELAPERGVWISRRGREELLEQARSLEESRLDERPLYGIPFVIKDNIDLAGVATTAACAEYAYTPQRSAAVVQRLVDAGAIPLGKTNLDQFATGLVGTRSPYGACHNSIDPSYIAGGSSSGSAVAVALGLASFGLGTDTAGSGRIPAAFNNLVGLKPSLGCLSTRGVVPACRSLDCVSIFALTAEDAAAVMASAAGYDPQDPYSTHWSPTALDGCRFGVPRGDQLEFFGDTEYEHLFDRSMSRVEALGGSVVRIDFGPFLEAAQLLYGGPWVAERYAAAEQMMRHRPQALHPVTRQIIEAGEGFSAVDAFKGLYRLKALARAAERAWESADLLLTPTAGTIHRLAQVEADPIRLNTQLGYYTNFMNLLDLAGVAVPAGFRGDGLPFGVTLVGRRGTEIRLLQWASRLQRELADRLGALDCAVPAPEPALSDVAAAADGPHLSLAVCGAHMRALPLNHQLVSRGGRLLRLAKTAPRYRLLALPGDPPRPGLVRSADDGTSIDLEVWSVRSTDVGSLLQGLPAPLGLGKVELQDGEVVTGFLCEAHGAPEAVDISSFGGWRAFLAARPEVGSPGGLKEAAAAADKA